MNRHINHSFKIDGILEVLGATLIFVISNGFLGLLCCSLCKRKFDFGVKLVSTNTEKKKLLKTKKKVKDFMENTLKGDAILFSGSKTRKIEVAIENATNSNVSHCQYIHYLGNDENGKSKFETIESAVSYDCDGISKNETMPKLFKDGERLSKDWCYICPLNSTLIKKEQFQKIHNYFKKIESGKIKYDNANLFQDSFGIRLKNVEHLLSEILMYIEAVEKFLRVSFCCAQKKPTLSNFAGKFQRKLTSFLFSIKRGVEQNNSLKKMVCSELIGYLLQIGGVIHKDHNISNLTPQDIAELKIYTKCYVLNYGKFQSDDLRNFNTDKKYLLSPSNTLKNKKGK